MLCFDNKIILSLFFILLVVIFLCPYPKYLLLDLFIGWYGTFNPNSRLVASLLIDMELSCYFVYVVFVYVGVKMMLGKPFWSREYNIVILCIFLC